MSYIIHPSPRKHNEFSYEDKKITYWWEGFVGSIYNIYDDEIFYYIDITEKEKDELYYLTILFLREIESEL